MSFAPSKVFNSYHVSDMGPTLYRIPALLSCSRCLIYKVQIFICLSLSISSRVAQQLMIISLVPPFVNTFFWFFSKNFFDSLPNFRPLSRGALLVYQIEKQKSTPFFDFFYIFSRFDKLPKIPANYEPFLWFFWHYWTMPLYLYILYM